MAITDKEKLKKVKRKQGLIIELTDDGKYYLKGIKGIDKVPYKFIPHKIDGFTFAGLSDDFSCSKGIVLDLSSSFDYEKYRDQYYSSVGIPEAPILTLGDIRKISAQGVSIAFTPYEETRTLSPKEIEKKVEDYDRWEKEGNFRMDDRTPAPLWFFGSIYPSIIESPINPNDVISIPSIDTCYHTGPEAWQYVQFDNNHMIINDDFFANCKFNEPVFIETFCDVYIEEIETPDVWRVENGNIGLTPAVNEIKRVLEHQVEILKTENPDFSYSDFKVVIDSANHPIYRGVDSRARILFTLDEKGNIQTQVESFDSRDERLALEESLSKQGMSKREVKEHVLNNHDSVYLPLNASDEKLLGKYMQIINSQKNSEELDSNTMSVAGNVTVKDLAALSENSPKPDNASLSNPSQSGKLTQKAKR